MAHLEPRQYFAFSSPCQGLSYFIRLPAFDARMIRQASDTDGIYKRTWGYDRGGPWVNDGCRADFEVGLGR